MLVHVIGGVWVHRRLDSLNKCVRQQGEISSEVACIGEQGGGKHVHTGCQALLYEGGNILRVANATNERV